VGCLSSNSCLDFGGDPNHDMMQEFLMKCLPLRDKGDGKNFVSNSGSPSAD